MGRIKKIGMLFCLMIIYLTPINIHAEESTYKNITTKTQDGITFKVEWNEPVLGQETTFHVSTSDNSGSYKFFMESPVYYNPGETNYEVIQDPSRVAKYTDLCASHDYQFIMTASGTYELTFSVMDVSTTPVKLFSQKIKVAVSDSAYPSVNEIVKNTVAKCNSETSGSDYEKALWLHDWLIDQMEYDYSYLWASAESALTRHKGTCQSYEDAYELLLNEAGIKNQEIRDTYDTHTWNAAYLDGEWYQIDCTNDDSSIHFYYSDQRHLYFGLTDELMAIAHNGHNKIYTASGYSTRSTSLKNNYYVKTGEAEIWAKTYQDRIQEHLNNKETEFTISADNKIDQDKPTISGIYTGIIAYAMNQMSWKSDSDIVTLNATGDTTQFTFTATYSDDSSHVHTWDKGVVTSQPTCETTGIKTFTCTTCKQTSTSVLNALGHDYQWVQTKVPTCTESGSKSEICTRCNKVNKTSIIYANGHSYEWRITKDATCGTDGTKVYICNDCGDVSDTQIISATGNHRWNSGAITVQPTYTSNGIKTYTCDICHKTKTEQIAKIKTGYYNQWCYMNGGWYYFDGNGNMATNQWVGNYYVGNDGRMITNQWIGNCYFGSNGAYIPNGWRSNATGWWYRYGDGSYPCNRFEQIDGATYYFNGSGYMVTGWRYINNAWYYFNGSGAMSVNRWQGNYYLGSDGKMVTNQWIGKYYVGSNGAWVQAGWKSNATGWWYQYATGGYPSNQFEQIDGATYYFNGSGYMVTGWRYINNAWYYFNGSGAMSVNRWQGNYYLGSDGKMVTNQWIGKYYVGSNGAWIPNYQ